MQAPTEMTHNELCREIDRLTRVFAVFRKGMGPYEQIPISQRRRECREELERRGQCVSHES